MKRRNIGLFIFSIILVHFKTISQTVEPSSGVENNTLQFEVETVYSSEKEGTQKTTSWSMPNILIRYGLSERFELQLHTPFTKERCIDNKELKTNIFKFDDMELGVSINLWEQNKLLPETAIMARVVMPTSTFKPAEFGNIVSLNFSNSISNKTSLNYNIGTTTSTNRDTSWFYIMNLNYEPNSTWHFFIENSSNFTFKETKAQCLGSGFGVNLNSNFTVDFSIAKSLKNKMFYSGAILTWVVPAKKKQDATYM